MPLFDFKCPDCKTTREVLVRRSEDIVQTCDLCHSVMQKLTGAPAFRVKGFSAINGYSRTDTGWVRDPKHPGMKIRVADNGDGRER